MLGTAKKAQTIATHVLFTKWTASAQTDLIFFKIKIMKHKFFQNKTYSFLGHSEL